MSAGWVWGLVLAVVPQQSGGDRLLADANRLKAAGNLVGASELLARAGSEGALAPAAQSLLVELLLRQQDADAARTAALAGLRQTPDSAYLRLCLGDACWLLRDLAQAEVEYRWVAGSQGEFADAARQRLASLGEDLVLVRRAGELATRGQWLAVAAALVLVLATIGAARVARPGARKHSRNAQ